MYFFKDTNSNWIIGDSLDSIVSKVPCKLRKSSATMIFVQTIESNMILFPPTEVTAIRKNAVGDYYASFTEFKTAVSDFFDNAPITAEDVDVKIGAAMQISLTYSELYALKQANNLVPGQSYLITDYQTVHTIPNTTDVNTGQIEPLLVMALTNNKLSAECYSTLFPQDIIYYDIENNQAMVPGCTKGLIYRRIDTLQKNDIPFDYRNVKFRRWQISVTTEHADGNSDSFAKGSVVKKTGTNQIYIKLCDAAGLFSDTSFWRPFEWNNLQYVSLTETEWYIANDVFQVIIPTNLLYNDYYMFSTEPTVTGIQSSYANIHNNKIGGTTLDILVNYNSVIFGANFNSNSIGANFNSNSIGANFNSNSIGANFNNNSIGANFNSNSIGANFKYNSIGANFKYNSIGANFNNNSIGANFNSNSIGAYFTSNSIGANFNYNKIEDGFNSDYNGVDFTIATYVYLQYNKTLFKNSLGEKKLSYYNDSNVLVVVNANS